MKSVVRTAVIVIAVAVVAVGVLYWRGLLFHSKSVEAGAAKPKTVAKATPTPLVLPSDAPKVSADTDPAVIGPFALRLAKVNAMAHRTLVTNAEYHVSDAGDRYFVAVVTSCKDLLQIWPLKGNVLVDKVENPLRLKSDFSTFSFVEYYSQGQWGVSSCDGTT